MAPGTFLSASPRLGTPARHRRSSMAPSVWRPSEQRLVCAERELRIQFTRIAQLQAELDLLQAALRRSPDGSHKR